tara:strand:+ start:962 stop:1243 length:282 start_codon:yes stop_codon:yes gene_type:complete
MTPNRSLARVRKIIKERGETHGDYRETFDMCAKLWSVYLGIPISPSQVCVLNTLQKLARDQNAETPNIENMDDSCGYLVIAAAFQEALKKEGS